MNTIIGISTIQYGYICSLTEFLHILKDLQTLIGFGIVILSWFITFYLNKKSERMKKRLEYRLTNLESIFTEVVGKLLTNAQKTVYEVDFNKKLNEAIFKIQLFGTEEEIAIFKKFADAINDPDKEKRAPRAEEVIPDFKKIHENFRKELGLN